MMHERKKLIYLLNHLTEIRLGMKFTNDIALIFKLYCQEYFSSMLYPVSCLNPIQGFAVSAFIIMVSVSIIGLCVVAATYLCKKDKKEETAKVHFKAGKENTNNISSAGNKV